MLLLCVFLVWVLPLMILPLFPLVESNQETPQALCNIEPVSNRIRVLQDGMVTEMDVDTYVASVLLAEMPASFEQEALKAQAVATRTYTLRRLVTDSKHPQAHVCTDSGCCQAFAQLTTDSASKLMYDAASQTTGIVLMYDGELIEATYFSCSGGRTESALEVWGSDVPYLQSRVSPGEEIASHYRDTYILSFSEFAERLDLENESQIDEISYTDGGGIQSITIGGSVFSGTELRKRLALKSTAATFTPFDDGYLITTQGYGHRVGMSQYGAEAMALTGSDYREILAHYYPGTNCATLSQEELSLLFDKAGNL